MDWLFNVTFDQIGASFLAVFMIREAMIAWLPDDIVGPGGWLIDTGCETCED